ncbi:MAG: UDP-2,3-diacylglucosamine diphosphatase [Cryomorphaceae bacterium]|jgi:UDP-2,3-diacylglucosamine pyrophosphatase LpxH|nr:UDP-2,3-diacylglucosamine diphosphatase [Cryomorphaceae bacterium]
MSSRRHLAAVVLSDLHLGTFGCHARELLAYLKSIQPDVLILNGDIIDIWNFKKSYFPKSHFKVVKRVLTMAQKGTKVYYITGNHDEMLRRFADADLGQIHLRNQLVLTFGGVRTWIFHGDIFDASIQNARWLAKLGGWSYDLLIWVNRWLNVALERMGREKYSLSKTIKDSVKKAVKYVGDFEVAAAEMAVRRGYGRVICGHIHQPQMRKIRVGEQDIDYLNSGDWIENLTALEWNGREWTLYQHPDVRELEEVDEKVDASARHLLSMLLNEADSEE